MSGQTLSPAEGTRWTIAVSPGVDLPMRGDRVEIVVDAGGESRTYEIVATRNGRRVEIATGRGVVEVSEVTRGGTPVRTARFMANRVLALVEHPAQARAIADETVPVQPSPAARPRRANPRPSPDPELPRPA